MADFKPFAELVHKRFAELSKHELFVVGDDNRAFEARYLAAFPEGTNPIFKTNTEHDCSCCKQFIRNIGNLVAIINGKLHTVWGIVGAEYPYDVVAASMDEFVKSLPITNVWRATEPSYGAAVSRQLLDGGAVMNWNHFHGSPSARHFAKKNSDELSGQYRTTVQVFQRGLEELTAESVDSVLELIDSKALYRGEEHKPALIAFRRAQQEYAALSAAEKNWYVWLNAGSPNARFRNTVIGTLVQDLSSGVELEAAVRSFEVKVAPSNYKRPTALITPSMVKDAMKTIGELGLEGALQRRFAVIGDVTVNNVLWVDNAVKGRMKGGIESVLMEAATAVVSKPGKAEPITIDEFMATVVPTATSMALFVKSQHMGNMMSLTAPVNPDSGHLFKWPNDFGWSYSGNIADSAIKERVKKAGGNVTNAKLRVSLSWQNFDDLDIHVHEPDGNHIYFGNKGGKLDVDMNAGRGVTREPVENVSWTSLRDGRYLVEVNQFSLRETTDVGFTIEIESQGQLIHLTHQKAIRARDTVKVATITLVNGRIEKLEPGPDMVGGAFSQDVWGIRTETFAKVQTLMFSPNYWDGNAVGNKHWFFILEGCRNTDPTRGIYNEFLNSKLDKHRKVFEILGDKTKCEPSADQLSGLGFSSTKGDTVQVQVTTGKSQRLYEINF